MVLQARLAAAASARSRLSANICQARSLGGIVYVASWPQLVMKLKQAGVWTAQVPAHTKHASCVAFAVHELQAEPDPAHWEMTQP